MREYEDFELAFDRLLGLAYGHARRLVGDHESGVLSILATRLDAPHAFRR